MTPMSPADSSILDSAFLEALLRSPTFWLPSNGAALAGTAGLAALLLVLSALLLGTRPGRRARADLAADETGSVTALDLVLVTPLFVLFMFMVFQFAILSKNHLFTHYAAYQAARSARVHFCPIIPLGAADVVNRMPCRDSAAAGKADLAARLALIPAAPYRQVRCSSGCAYPDAVLRAVFSTTGQFSLSRAMTRQARYMFDKQNVKVTVQRAPLAMYARGVRSPHVPVVATVEARFLLLEYAGWVFADGRRSDGNTYTISRAEVSLL